MGLATYRTGQALAIDGAPFTMRRKLPSGQWQIEHLTTGELRNLGIDQLNEAYVAGELRFQSANSPDSFKPDRNPNVRQFRMFKELPERLQIEAKWRYAYVRAVINACLPALTEEYLNPIIKVVSTRQKIQRQPPHYITVYRWVTRYQKGGQDIMALVPYFHLKGNSKRRYPAKVLELVEQAVDSVYMKPERKTLQDTLDHAISEVARANRLRTQNDQLKLPTRSLVKFVIKDIPAEERCEARYGRMYALKKFRSVKGHFVAERLLQYTEMDHAKFDVIVVDDDTRLPLGRPYITISIELLSRCVHGIYVGFVPPSLTSVFRCLKHGFLPKVTLRKTYPCINNEWDCHGVMDTLIVDNGLEFHADDLEELGLNFGFTIQYCGRKRPWHKPHIERLIGTINREVSHGQPGTTFSSILEKEDYDPVKTAVISLSAFREMIYKWIVDVYHQRPHRALHDTPANVWRDHAPSLDINLPEDPRQLDAMLCRVDTRTLTHKGIEIHDLFYNSDDIQEFRRQLGESLEVTIRYDDSDLGYIYITHPDGKIHVRVPALNQAYASGINLWQHKVFKKYVKQRLNAVVDIIALTEAKRQVAEIVEREFLDTRKTVRSRSARLRTEGTFTDAGRSKTDSVTTASAVQSVSRNADINTGEALTADARARAILRRRGTLDSSDA